MLHCRFNLCEWLLFLKASTYRKFEKGSTKDMFPFDMISERYEYQKGTKCFFGSKSGGEEDTKKGGNISAARRSPLVGDLVLEISDTRPNSLGHKQNTGNNAYASHCHGFACSWGVKAPGSQSRSQPQIESAILSSSAADAPSSCAPIQR
jgi:hypothetical protein